MKKFRIFIPSCILFISMINIGYCKPSTFAFRGYSEEFPAAYTRAFNNGITNKQTIEKADMYGKITRIELAKMISNYSINILNKKVDTSKKCKFDDISENQDKQYDYGVTKSCQLGLMGQGITNFRPYDYITRAEFGTVLSRLLYGNKYNGGTPYYEKHLKQLNSIGVITNISNASKGIELRGNVMVMLKRSESGEGKENVQLDSKIPTIEELDEVAFKCPYCAPDGCDFYDLGKGNFIIPYKDGYIGYTWRDNMGDARLQITYRKLDDPCDITYSTDVFHYNYDNIKTAGCVLDYSYSSKKVESFISKEEDPWKCMDDAEKYFYNLIVGGEKDEIFTLWMNSFKKNIDNNSFSKDWRSEIYECKENHRGEDYKGADITSFMTETTFDAEGYEEAIKDYDIKDAEIGYSCIKEILKN